MPVIKKHAYFLIPALLLLVLSMAVPLFPQETETAAESEDLVEFMEEGMKEIDYYSLEELLDVEVEVASLFAEDELVVGSTVSSISSNKIKQLGARRMHEALNNEMGVQTTPTIAGIYTISVRGYTSSESLQGIAFLIDGTPVNILTLGSALGAMPNIELGIIDKIEMIKGPGSSIYGSDAFHGVLLLKTFESDKNHYSVEGAGAYPLYGDANLKMSQGFYDNLFRIDVAVSASRQGEQDLEYEYNDDGDTGKGTREMTHDSRSGTFKIRINPLDKLHIKLGSYITYFNCDDYPGTHKVGDAIHLRDKDLSSNNAVYYIGTGKAAYEYGNGISIEADTFYSRASLEYTLMTSTISSVTQNGGIDQTGAKITIKQPDNPLNLQWLVAYSYTRGELKENSYFQTINSMDSPEEDLDAKGFTRTINSVFTQLKWGAIKDRLYFLLGGRMDDYSDSGSSYDPEDFGLQYSPRGGIIFLPTDKSSIKALYGRAFKAPNQVQIFGFPFLNNPNLDLEPEIIDVYELTFMYREKNWKTEITGFYSFWEDAILPLRPPGSTTSIYLNAGKNDSIGGEMNIFYSFDPFTFKLGYAYVRSYARDLKNMPNMPDPGDIKYDANPEHSAQCGLNYLLKPYGINFYLNNRFYYKWKPATVQEADDLPPYYRADVNISKSFTEGFEYYLDIRNILNRENHVPGAFAAENGHQEPGISVLLRAGYKL